MSDEPPLGPAKDIMMAVSSPEAIREAELLTLRQIARSIDATATRLDRLGESVADVRERLVRIESNKMDHTVAELKSELRAAQRRIDVLESDLEQRRGAGKLLDFVQKFGPWLLGLAASLFVLASGGVRLTQDNPDRPASVAPQPSQNVPDSRSFPER